MVDALASGASTGNGVEVRVLFWAPEILDFQEISMCLRSNHYTSAPHEVQIMLVMIKLNYVTADSKSGILKYRRRVPSSLQLALGKKEFVISFKTKQHERVLQAYDQVHRQVERELAVAREKSPEQISYQATLIDLRKHDLVDPRAVASGPLTIGVDEELGMKSDLSP